MSRILSEAEIDDLAVGAWIIGTGGGGSPYLNHLSVKRLCQAGQNFELIHPDELADDARVAVVSTMGAPLVMQERLQDSVDAARAVEVLANYLGAPFDAIMAVEIGGSNALPAIHGRRSPRHSHRRCRCHGSRLSRGPDDQLRGGRIAAVAAFTCRSTRHRSRHQPCAHMEVDGTIKPSPDNRSRFNGCDLQGTPDRRRGQRVGSYWFGKHRDQAGRS